MFGLKNNTEEGRLRAFAKQNGAFDSKKGAFDYFFFIEGKTVEEAERLANVVAAARNVPDAPVIPAGGLDKVKGYVKQGVELASEYPQITDFVVGLLGGALTSLTGVVVGNKISESNQPEQRADIDTNAEPEAL